MESLSRHTLADEEQGAAPATAAGSDRGAASGPRSTVHLARMRAGLEPPEGILPLPPDRPAVQPAGGGTVLSWRRWYAPVEPLAVALRVLGLQEGDRVLLLSETRMEWFQTDLAIAAAGGWSVPVFPTLPAAQLEEILADSEANFAVVSRPALLEELLRARPGRLRVCILMDAPGGETRGERAAGPETTAEILSWEEALEIGRTDTDSVAEAVEARAQALTLDTPATLIYTSGTTGKMKGVVLTHGNLLSTALSSARRLDVSAEDIHLSFLPLSHVLERVVHLSMLAAGASIHYSEGLDRLEQDFRRVRPTIVVGVPRLYEKVLLEAEEKARRLGPRLHLLFRLAEQAARRAGRRGPGSRPRGPLGWFWDALVYRKIRRGLGGRIRCLISGGAPLGRREALFLNGCGLALLEGYGLTETASVIAVNVPGAWRLGSVGRPLPEVEVRVAEDGEILLRGPSVMSGYYHDRRAGDEAGGDDRPAEDTVRDGWLSTGDVGRVDDDGFLFIAERKKDLIATAQGKKVAPQLVESSLRRSPLVTEAVVLGERRPYLIALLFPDLERLRARSGLMLPPGPDLSQSLNSPSVRALMRSEIDQHCQDLAPHERVRDFFLLPHAPEVADGTMTPTQKVRRGEIARVYAAEINRLYQRPPA